TIPARLENWPWRPHLGSIALASGGSARPSACCRSTAGWPKISDADPGRARRILRVARGRERGSSPSAASEGSPVSRQPARMLIGLTALALIVAATFPAVVLAANLPPDQPTITEPATDGQIVNPFDVHMETAPFSDPDGDSHLCTDWVIEVAATSEVAWQALCSPILVHIHLGDGTFMNSYAGKAQLDYDKDYVLRVRDSDNSGDPATQWSPWAQRL